jgi:hypothetical protein
MRAKVVDNDFPCWEDVPVDLPEDMSDRYDELYHNVRGLKLGGWPTLIQSEIFWAPWNKHPASPEYVFQVDSSVKAGWSWEMAASDTSAVVPRQGKKTSGRWNGNVSSECAAGSPRGGILLTRPMEQLAEMGQKCGGELAAEIRSN